MSCFFARCVCWKPVFTPLVNRLSKWIGVCLCAGAAARAGTVTVETNVLAPTPTIVGYDSGHFWPASNTGDWLRYSGITGVRIFVSPGAIESTNQFPAIDNTVTNESSFLNLKAEIRANPWSTTYLNWPFVTNQFNTPMLIGSDYVDVDYDLATMQQFGAQAVIQSTASTGQFGVSTWTEQFQLWQFYYQQAFYLGYVYGVERYQMYNEPDDGGPTGTNYLIRLQLASDAIQSAIADVNTMYGKSLTPIGTCAGDGGSADEHLQQLGGIGGDESAYQLPRPVQRQLLAHPKVRLSRIWRVAA